jgi:hypothetical protein
MLAIDLGTLVKLVLYLLFADLTAMVAAITGPTYDQLLVPELDPGGLFPPLVAAHLEPSNFLAPAAEFSRFLVVNVVDPAIALAALGIALLYFGRATVTRWGTQFDALLPRLVLAVTAANFAVPIAGGILGVASSLYPVVAGWDGGAWRHWVRLGGFAEIWFSWDNGALAFVLSLVEFILVIGLVLAIAVRDALLAVLLVLLPVFSLLWPFRPLSSVARRAWFLFAELAFLPCVLVIPLELAVGSPSPVILVGFLAVALGSPVLLSVAGSHLTAFGFPGAGPLVLTNAQRGLTSAPGAAVSGSSSAGLLRSPGSASAAIGRGLRAAGTASAPLAAPLAVRELLGHAATRLVRHVGRPTGGSSAPSRIPPLRPGDRG